MSKSCLVSGYPSMYRSHWDTMTLSPCSCRILRTARAVRVQSSAVLCIRCMYLFSPGAQMRHELTHTSLQVTAQIPSTKISNCKLLWWIVMPGKREVYAWKRNGARRVSGLCDTTGSLNTLTGQHQLRWASLLGNSVQKTVLMKSETFTGNQKINKWFKIKLGHNLKKFLFLELRWVVATHGQILASTYFKRSYCFPLRQVHSHCSH